jgi:hypothetical protein
MAEHDSINDTMIKIGNCVDNTALRMLEKRVLAFLAEQLVTASHHLAACR